MATLKGPRSPRALLPELQRYKDTARCAALGAEVLGHRQQQLMQTLILGLLKTHFLYRSLIVKSQQIRIELVTRPAIVQTVLRQLQIRPIRVASTTGNTLPMSSLERGSIDTLPWQDVEKSDHSDYNWAVQAIVVQVGRLRLFWTLGILIQFSESSDKISN